MGWGMGLHLDTAIQLAATEYFIGSKHSVGLPVELVLQVKSLVGLLPILCSRIQDTSNYKTKVHKKSQKYSYELIINR